MGETKGKSGTESGQSSGTAVTEVAIPESSRATLVRIEWIANIMDTALVIPGTKFRFGLDPIIGLCPGLGDIIPGLISLYIVAEAAMAGAPTSVLVRMVYNIVIDTSLGMVPFVGDWFDFVWKSNQMNRDLLARYFENPQKTAHRSKLWLIMMMVLNVLAYFLVVALVGVVLFGIFYFSKHIIFKN